jgi:hypothetical protein
MMDPNVQKYLSDKYQLGLSDEEKAMLSGSDQRAADVDLGQGMMDAARSISAGIAGQGLPTKSLFAENSANGSSDQVRKYILNKLNDRRGAAKMEQEQVFKDRERQEDRAAKSDDLKVKTDANAIAAESKNAMRDDLKKNREFGQYDKLTSQREGHEITKATGARVNMYNNIKSSSETGSAQSDQVMIYSFMKMLDPTSAVLPGEYKSAKDAAGISEKVGTTLAGWQDGQLLSPEQRRGILEEARKMHDKQVANQIAYDNTIMDEAKARGLDPKRVVRDPYKIHEQDTAGQATKKPVNVGVTRASNLPSLKK